jgi:hypothetical protein
MTVETTDLRAIKLDYRCDKCGVGHYRSTGVTLTSYPAQYPHRCDKCDGHKTFLCIYPTTVHVPVEEPFDAVAWAANTNADPLVQQHYAPSIVSLCGLLGLFSRFHLPTHKPE